MAGMAMAVTMRTTYRNVEEPVAEKHPPAKEITWRSYEEMGHAMGAATRRLAVGAVTSTVKGVTQAAVVLPVQQVGRQGQKVTVNTLAQALPGIVRRSSPTLRKRLEQRLRQWASGEEDINEHLTPTLAGRIRLLVECSDELEPTQRLNEDDMPPMLDGGACSGLRTRQCAAALSLPYSEKAMHGQSHGCRVLVFQQANSRPPCACR